MAISDFEDKRLTDSETGGDRSLRAGRLPDLLHQSWVNLAMEAKMIRAAHVLKVVRPDAVALAAQMVQDVTLRDRADEAFVDHPVSSYGAAAGPTIAISLDGFIPGPAERGVAAVFVVVDELRPWHPACVSVDEAERLACDVATRGVRVRRQRGLLTTAAHAQAGWVRPFAFSTLAHWVSSLVEAALLGRGVDAPRPIIARGRT